MYKQPTIPSVRSASRCGPKLFVFALVCPSIRNKARDSLVVACLTFSKRLDGRSGSLSPDSPLSQSTVLTQRWSPAHAQSAAEKTGLGCGQYFQMLFADG